MTKVDTIALAVAPSQQSDHITVIRNQPSAQIWYFIENQLLTAEHWFYKNSPVYLWSDDRLSQHFSIY